MNTSSTEPSRMLAEWLAYIERQHPKSIALGLERVREVAARMQLARPARQQARDQAPETRHGHLAAQPAGLFLSVAHLERAEAARLLQVSAAGRPFVG